MIQAKKKSMIEELEKKINTWNDYSEIMYGYSKQDAKNFLKRFRIGIYDSILKETYWFGQKLNIDNLVCWDADRRKNNMTTSNITEENFIVYTALLSVKDHARRVNEWPQSFQSNYTTRYSRHQQSPMNIKEQNDFNKFYSLTLNKNYTWREAREVVTNLSKLNVYEHPYFPHNLDEVATCFSPTVKTFFQDFFPEGQCYFETSQIEKKALELAKSLTEKNLPDLFRKPSQSHIEEYLRRMILSMYDIPRLIHNYSHGYFKDNIDKVRYALSTSTTMSDEVVDILFRNSNKKELLSLAQGILLSLSVPKKPLQILQTCKEYQDNLKCNHGTVYYNDVNRLRLPNGDVIFSTDYESIEPLYKKIQKRYEFFYKNATELEYVEGCAETIGSVLISQIFREGNKRTAKCLFNSLLISRGIVPPIIDLNENEYELWNDFAYSRKDRFTAAIPKVLEKTTSQAKQLNQETFSMPVIISEDAVKRPEFKKYSY